MRRWRAVAAGAAVLLAVVFVAPAYALDPPPKPTDIPVVDQTNTLNDQQKQVLAAKIKAERDKTNNQVAILMIPSLQDDAIEDYSLRVARDWGIGGSERDSGVLLLIAKEDRKLRIEVGYGLEGALPDARASRIIREQISPQFRQDKYYEGIDAGLTGIIGAINGEADTSCDTSGKRARAACYSEKDNSWLAILAPAMIIPTWLGSVLGRTKSWWAGGVIGAGFGVLVGIFFGFLFTGIAAIAGLALLGLLFDRFVSNNYQKHAEHGGNPAWWAGGPWLGGGGSGNDSGGFGGFGGGGFGGGGSSGSW